MRKRVPEGLSATEREIIQEIRALRNSAQSVWPADFLHDPAQLVHHFIRASHGNVQLRIRPIARELGVEMRTLERSFTGRFGMTMAQCQRSARFEFSCWMLTLSPPTKITVIASLLGYRQVQDFNRFFRKQAGMTPFEWRSEKEKKAASDQQ
ncbi:MAG TPA: helix-turn-helix domain-containing protein [Alloacidobacterium sp.]|nr:helix-turn-helix domain-containing protein [Alloacidobacterium sp.]